MNRRFILILLFSIIIIPIYTLAHSTVPGISLEEAMKEEKIKLNMKDKEKQELLSKIIVLPKENYDKESAVDMIQRVGNIHPSLLREIVANGVRLKLFHGKLTEEPMFEHLKGKTPKGWSTGSTWEDSPGAGGGYVAAAKIGHSYYGDGHGSVNLELHEIAHSYAEKVYGSKRLREDFASIWKEEAPQIYSERDYFINFMGEYFAETFAMYYFSPSSKVELQKKAPKTYKFFVQLEKRPYKWYATLSPKL